MPAFSVLRYFELHHINAKLKHQACLDLAERGVHAIPGYLLIWSICLLSGEIWQQSLAVVLGGSAFILGSVAARLGLRQWLRQHPQHSRWQRYYSLQTLSSGLFWGMFLSWQINSHPANQAMVPLMAASGMAAASLTNLCPHLWVCRSFSLLLLSPLAVCLAANSELLHTSLLVFTYLLFLLSLAKRLNREYWHSLETADQLQNQAEELKRLHQQAVNALQLRTQFLANMSHEIRTPMNGVLGLLELLRTSPQQPEQRQQLDIAYASGQNLLALLNDILDLSRLEAGKVELEQQAFDFEQLIQELLALYRPRAEQKGCQILFDFSFDCPHWLFGDRLRLWQVLNNLLSNALKFTEHGEIRLQLSYPDSQLHINVQDTGIGIAADQLQRIFDNFTQADGSVTRRFGGSGLGLSIVRHLVELMQGSIEVHSILGQGSQFSLRLPLKAAPVQTRQQQSFGPMPHSLSLLVVDDNQVNQLVTQSMLKHLGHQVSLADNGQQALDWLANHRVDIVLMDVQMPVLDGLSATRQLRSQLNATPVIGLTAHAMDSDRLDCLAAGMDDVLTKPLDLNRLTTCLARWQPTAAKPD